MKVGGIDCDSSYLKVKYIYTIKLVIILQIQLNTQFQTALIRY